MHGGEESLPSAPLIGLMRSRVNRRTNDCMPLSSQARTRKGYRVKLPGCGAETLQRCAGRKCSH